MYSVILIMFGTASVSSSQDAGQFEATKPTIAIYNHDEDGDITHSFVEYLNQNAELKTDYSKDKIKDGLFYAEIVMAIDIPEDFSRDFADGKNPAIHTQSSAGYNAELAKVMVERYWTTAQSYADAGMSTKNIIAKIDPVLKSSIEVERQSKADTSKYTKAARYFSFANYAILACVITIICLIISSFNRRELRRRNLVSSTPVTKMNRVLLANSCIYSFSIWTLYIAVGFFTVGKDSLISMNGLLYMGNSFIFCVCATTIAYLISQLVRGSNAINAVMNIVALGSSFLCGCFVPAEFLPDSVLTFAHVLPSFYYVDANNKILRLENTDFETIRPVLVNIAIVLGFSVLFVVVANIVSKRKQKE
jgi:ABC-2 type transport system permease protein